MLTLDVYYGMPVPLANTKYQRAPAGVQTFKKMEFHDCLSSIKWFLCGETSVLIMCAGN